MRDISIMPSSTSSSIDNGNNDDSFNAGKQGNLINDISNLRSRLKKLDHHESPAAPRRPRSQSALDTSPFSGREPPIQSESVLVNQLRNQVSKLEHEKAEMELTLMNQMSKLAFENQKTIDDLQSRLAQSEKLQGGDNTKVSLSSSSSSLEVQRLRRSLNDEQGMRQALEEERDARNMKLQKANEQRESMEKENVNLKGEVQKMRQQMSNMEGDNAKLSDQVQKLQQQLESRHESDASQQVGDLRSQLIQEQSTNQSLEYTIQEQKKENLKLWNSLEDSQRRCTMFEEELSRRSGGNDPSGLIGENEMLSSQIAAIHEQCVNEQEKCAQMKAALENEKNINNKLKLSLRQHQQRYEELNKNLHKNQSGASLFNGRVAALEKENKAMNTQLAEVKDLLTKEKAKSMELETSLEQTQSLMEERIHNSAGRRQSDAAALESTQLELQSVLNSYQSDVTRLERKVQLAEQQLSEKNRQNQRLEVEINEERRIRKSLSAQLNQSKSFKQSCDVSDSGSVQSQVSIIDHQKKELENLRNQNADLREQLSAVKGNEPCQVSLSPAHRKSLSGQSTSPLRKSFGVSLRAPPSPGDKREMQHAGMQTPPMSPPLMKKKSSMSNASPVKGIVESFERRISRSNSTSSLVSAGEANNPADNQQEQNKPQSKQPRLLPLQAPNTHQAMQSQGAFSSELDELRRELMEERAAVQELKQKCQNEAELVENLRLELSKMKQTESKRAEVEQLLQDREDEIVRLGGKIRELESTSQEAEDFRQSFEQQKLVVHDLEKKLQAEADLVAALQSELTILEDKEVIREEEILALQGRVNEMEDIAAEAREVRQARDIDKAAVRNLEQLLQTESSRTVELETELLKLEEKEASNQQEISRLQERIAELQDIALQVGEFQHAWDADKAKVKDLEQKLQSEREAATKIRSRVGELEMVLANPKSLSTDEAELEKLRGELAQADSARQAFERKLFEDRAEIERLQAEVKAAETRLRHSLTEQEELDATNDRLEQQKQEDDAIIERLQAELGAARMGLEQSLDEIERMKINASTTKNGIDEKALELANAEILQLRSDLQAAKEALDVNIEEMEKMQKCVKDADASRIIAFRQNESSKQEIQQELDQLRANLAVEEKSTSSQDEELGRLRQQCSALQEELAGALLHIDELKETIAKIQHAHSSELEEAQKGGTRTSRSIGKEVNTLKVELTKNQISKADMQMEYMTKIHTLEGKIDSLQAETDKVLKQKEIELQQVQATLSTKEEQIAQLEREREQICSSMNNMSSTRKDEMDELQEELLDLTAKTASQTREIHSLKMQLEEHELRKSEEDKLQERIEELEGELRDMANNTSRMSMEGTRSANHSDMEIMRTENKMLRESIRDLGVERRNLQEKLDGLLAEKASSKTTQVLRERNAALKKEVEKLTKRLKKMEHSMTRFTI